MQLEAVDLEQLVQRNDLVRDGLGQPKNKAPLGAISASTAASDIGGQPRSRPIFANVCR